MHILQAPHVLSLKGGHRQPQCFRVQSLRVVLAVIIQFLSVSIQHKLHILQPFAGFQTWPMQLCE